MGRRHRSDIPGFFVQTIPMNLWKRKSCAPEGFTIPWVSFPLHKKKPSISDLCRHYVTRWKGLCCMGGTLHRDSFIGLECQKVTFANASGNFHKKITCQTTLCAMEMKLKNHGSLCWRDFRIKRFSGMLRAPESKKLLFVKIDKRI